MLKIIVFILNKLFDGLVARGKTTKGWLYGFKLHLVISAAGELVKVSFSARNKDDHKHCSTMVDGIFGISRGGG